jgi:glycosyltransferase involved in cell wall biosynthesis
MNVLTWHVHGSYLYYLAQCGQELYLPVKPGRPEGYGGRSGHFPWPRNVHEVPAQEVASLDVDCVLFQSRRNWEEDRFEVLSEAQRRLPAIYLEHDPPRGHPTDTRHPVDDPAVLVVHVTHFNALMWDTGRSPTRVVPHGVMIPAGLEWSGELDRGLVVVNNLASRGRRLGADIFERVRRQLPVELVGMGSEELGGLGDIPYPELHPLMARYRFFFNPIRYTSLGLAVCEAMMLGMPVVGLATTEMTTTIDNGASGHVDTDVDALIGHMANLLDDPALARRLGEGARRTAKRCFAIDRFRHDWGQVFAGATATPVPQLAGRSR